MLVERNLDLVVLGVWQTHRQYLAMAGAWMVLGLLQYNAAGSQATMETISGTCAMMVLHGWYSVYEGISFPVLWL